MSSWDEKTDREQTFFGVPITLDYKTLGVLIINLPYTTKRDYDSTQKFLMLVASALLQPIRVKHVIEMERQIKCHILNIICINSSATYH